MRDKMKHPIYELANKGYDFEVMGELPTHQDSIIEIYSQINGRISDIPWAELEKRQWVKGKRDISSLAPLALSSFDNTSGRALFRKANNVDDTIISFWLSRIETQAKIKFIDNPKLSFKKDSFNNTVLIDLAKKSKDTSFLNHIPEYLSEFGILLIYERGIPGLKADGVVLKLQNGIPVIGMSLRYSRLDNFWFTLMHELSHIVLHYDQMESPIIDNLETENVEALEIAANRLAQNSFVPRCTWNRCPPKYEKSNASVIKFAKEQGIHPAIVAGMLQKESNRYDRYRAIVDSVNVVEVLEGKE
jgi:HTH-type transcriptional regulator/antitoxin HigA